MKQYGLLEEEIVKLFREEIVNAWKDINEGFIKPIVIPVPILTRVLNFAHVMDVIYKDVDGYTNSHILKDHIVLLWVDLVTL
ncbi:hypothetical protein SLA2020_490600 [Shorea laevis]